MGQWGTRGYFIWKIWHLGSLPFESFYFIKTSKTYHHFLLWHPQRTIPSPFCLYFLLNKTTKYIKTAKDAAASFTSRRISYFFICAYNFSWKDKSLNERLRVQTLFQRVSWISFWSFVTRLKVVVVVFQITSFFGRKNSLKRSLNMYFFYYRWVFFMQISFEFVLIETITIVKRSIKDSHDVCFYRFLTNFRLFF